MVLKPDSIGMAIKLKFFETNGADILKSNINIKLPPPNVKSIDPKKLISLTKNLNIFLVECPSYLSNFLYLMNMETETADEGKKSY